MREKDNKSKITMKEKIILFYEYHYFNFIKDSMAPDVEIVNKYLVDSDADLEQMVSEGLRESDEHTYIGIAVDNRFRKETLLQLMLSRKVPANNILDIYKAYLAGYSKNRYQRIMNRTPGKKLDGLVLGISHGMTGIAEEKLPGNVCNLCYSSQDIYFNYLTLKKCYEEYYYELQHLKYVVIDMFDYFYFNFDTILSGAYDRFFEMSGFLCEERAPWNKQISAEQINEMLDGWWLEGKSIREQQLFSKLFPFARERDRGVYKNYPVYERFLSEDQICTYKERPNLAAPQMKVYDHTINFQISNMLKLLTFLKHMQPQIQIFLVLLPKYKAVEEAEKQVNETWKKLFLKIINEFKQNFAIELLDLKGLECISAQKEYYEDLTHLGYQGALKFTEHLSDLLVHQYGLKLS